MATKTLIRSKKKHEVQLKEGSHLAQRQQAPTADEPPVPALIRKTNRVRRTSDAPDIRTSSAPSIKSAATKTTSVKTVSAKTASARGKSDPPEARRGPAADPRKRSSPAQTDKKAASPRLPARVPADSLWEADSAVMQRLQALMQRNGQLSEQLQRLQSSSLPKGYKP